MKAKWLLMPTLLLFLSACANEVDKKDENNTVSATVVEEAKNEDHSIRAIGTHQHGRLTVKPASQASVETLGAPSCFGVETDLRWSGDYEMIWEPTTSNGDSIKIMTFPRNFEIVQSSDVPIKLQKFIMGETDIFAYIPRYTDCHALETYFFGIDDGEAFPITFDMNLEQVWTNIGQLPNHPFQVSDDELIITGGYGAGQEFIDVYHFYYDSNKHSMILQKTEQVDPNDIIL